MFVLGKPHPKFESKTTDVQELHFNEKLVVLPANIRLDSRDSPLTNCPSNILRIGNVENSVVSLCRL